jgi:hypothetical protein
MASRPIASTAASRQVRFVFFAMLIGLPSACCC